MTHYYMFKVHLMDGSVTAEIVMHLVDIFNVPTRELGEENSLF